MHYIYLFKRTTQPDANKEEKGGRVIHIGLSVPHCKRVAEHELESLNPEYDSMFFAIVNGDDESQTTAHYQFSTKEELRFAIDILEMDLEGMFPIIRIAEIKTKDTTEFFYCEHVDHIQTRKESCKNVEDMMRCLAFEYNDNIPDAPIIVKDYFNNLCLSRPFA